LRFSETPTDRAVWLAARRQWREATELLAASPPGLLPDFNSVSEFAKSALLSGNEELYQKLTLDAYQRFRGGDTWSRFYAAHVATLAPNPVLKDHYDELERLALDLYDPATSTQQSNRQERALLTAVWAALQADRLDDARQRLAELPKRGWVQNMAFPARAILAEKSGQHAEAVQRLDEALAVVGPSMTGGKAWFWEHESVLLVYLRTAERVVTGGTARCDALIQAAADEPRAQGESADPQTAAFDHCVLIARTMTRTWPAGHVQLARGRRLAEFGRFDDAEVDFNKAVELAPKDVEVRLARGAFLADFGDAERAAADFLTALDFYPGAGNEIKQAREPIYQELVRHDEVFARVAAQRGQDQLLWKNRMFHHVRQGNAALALKDAERVGNLSLGADSLSALRLCGDAAEFERYRQSALVLGNSSNRAFALGLAPTDGALLTALLTAAEETNGPDSNILKGMALLRAGSLEEAVVSLERAILPANAWHANAMIWPFLAISEHQRGNKERARYWLERTEFVLQLHEQATASGRNDTISLRHALFSEGWLRSVVYYCEAKALIDGVEFSEVARALLARWAKIAKQQATAQAAAQAARVAQTSQWEADLAAAVDRNPADVSAQSKLARHYAHTGRPAEAAAHYALALAHQPQAGPSQALQQLARDSLETLAAENRDVFEQLVKLRPADRRLWLARANHLAGSGLWSEAHEPLAKVVELDPTDFNPPYWMSALYLAQGDPDAFRKLSRECLARFADDERPRVANRLVMTCLILPDGGEGGHTAEEKQRIAQLVEKIKKSHAGQPRSEQRWDQMDLGLAEFRAGRFAEASQLLQQCIDPGLEYAGREGTACFLLAMAQHRLGKSEQAKATLQTGLDFADKTAPPPAAGGNLGTGWADWVRMDVLRREAVALLSGDPASAPAPNAP
jgi:tetratricopeptide (TPR) repeat protein